MKTLLSILIIASIFLTACTPGGDQDKQKNEAKNSSNCSGQEIITPVTVESKNTLEIPFTKGDGELCLYVENTTEKSPAGSVIHIDSLESVPHSDFNANFKKLERWFSNEEIPKGDHNIKIEVNGNPNATLLIKIFEDNGIPSKITPEQRVENIYRQYIKEAPNERIDFFVMLKTWMTPEELYNLLQTEDSIQLETVFVKLKKNDDTFSTFNQPMTKNEEVLGFLDYLNTSYDWYMYTEDIPNHMKTATLNDGSIIFSGFRASSLPENMTKFWNANPNKVRFVQAIRYPIDNSLGIYQPNEEVH